MIFFSLSLSSVSWSSSQYSSKEEKSDEYESDDEKTETEKDGAGAIVGSPDEDVSVFEDDFHQKVVASPSSKNIATTASGERQQQKLGSFKAIFGDDSIENVKSPTAIFDAEEPKANLSVRSSINNVSHSCHVVALVANLSIELRHDYHVFVLFSLVKAIYYPRKNCNSSPIRNGRKSCP